MIQGCVQPFIDRYSQYPDVHAWKMPGAGGGGYLYMIAKDPEAAARIKQILNENRQNRNARFVEMSLSTKGLQVSRS